MSHVAQVKTDIKINDLTLLGKCCEKIGLVFTLNKNTYKWYGTHVDDYCFDKETRILTENGFKYFYELTNKDSVFTLNQETHIMELENVNCVIENDYEGKLLKFFGKGICQIVTPNHRMFVKRREFRKDRKQTHYKIMEASELFKKGKQRYSFLKCGNWEGFKPEKIYVVPTQNEIENHHKYNVAKIMNNDNFSRKEIANETGKHISHIGKWLRGEQKPLGSDKPSSYDAGDFMELLGWFISEGNMVKKHNYRICITQVKKVNEEKFNRIKELLERMRINTYVYGEECFIIHSKRLYLFFEQMGLNEYAKDKFIPTFFKNMSKELLERMISSLLAGDGSEERRYYTASTKLRDDFIEIAIKCGYGCTFRLINVNCKCPVWDINISKRTVNHSISKVEEIEYNDKTYCISTKNGIVLIERNGKISWSGNSVPVGFQISDLGKCDHCISVKGNSKAYEIGVVERNGELLFLWDFWSGGFGLEKVIGKNAEKLVQAYKQEMIRKQAEQVAEEQAGYLSEYTNEQGEQVFVVETY